MVGFILQMLEKLASGNLLGNRRRTPRQAGRIIDNSAALEQRVLLSFSEFVDPHPAVGNQFGDTVTPLSTGNVVITSPGDDAGGTDAGAVYLFNGATGALISTLKGSHANDQIGYDGVTAVGSGNFVVRSRYWDNGAVADAGAVTWGSGKTGVAGVVSAANSLVGVKAGDWVGSDGVTVLTNGNYVVESHYWDNGAVEDAGASTWGNGTTGVKGVVSAANSLVGSQLNDYVGQDGITALSNGNYVVRSVKLATSRGGHGCRSRYLGFGRHRCQGGCECRQQPRGDKGR